MTQDYNNWKRLNFQSRILFWTEMAFLCWGNNEITTTLRKISLISIFFIYLYQKDMLWDILIN